MPLDQSDIDIEIIEAEIADLDDLLSRFADSVGTDEEEAYASLIRQKFINALGAAAQGKS